MKSLMPWKQKEQRTAPVLWDDNWPDSGWENPFKGLFPVFSNSFLSRLPSVDVAEDKDEVVVRAEIPGMSEKDINLSWHDGVLRISGEKRSEKEEKRKDRFYGECSYGYFSREIPVRSAVDWKAAKARYRHGVLTVTLPKIEHSCKAIEIKVN
jgi:HSP20 family protein